MRRGCAKRREGWTIVSGTGSSLGEESEESADCSSGTLKPTRHSCRKREGGRAERLRLSEPSWGNCRRSHGLGCVAAVDSKRGP